MVESDLIECLKALAHPLRWRIIDTLASGERNVGEIETVSGIGQPGLSQQLGVLRKAGLVDTRKEAKLVFYSVDQARLGKIIAMLATLAPAATVTPGSSGHSRTAAPGVANFARMA